MALLGALISVNCILDNIFRQSEILMTFAHFERYFVRIIAGIGHLAVWVDGESLTRQTLEDQNPIRSE